MTTPADAQPRKSSVLAKIGKGLLALGATLGYLVAVLPDYGYAPAIPLHVGFVLFLGLLWKSFFAPIRNWKLASSVALAGAGLVVAGALNMERAEQQLRAEVRTVRHERLGLTDDRRLYDDSDPFGKELEKAFGSPSGWAPDWSRRPAMAKMIEDRKAGWPRVLAKFRTCCVFEGIKGEGGDSNYGGEPRLGCGHYWANSTIFGFTNYSFVSYALKAERRLLAGAERERELFLVAWKKLPPEERGEMVEK